MASLCTSNVTSGFIDLATFDELEKYMYGGPDATAYFVRETRKSTWFTQVPVVLSRANGVPGFGTEWAASISRAGDYLLATWLRLTTPKLTPVLGANQRMRWTRNLMHNLIRECCITFNDLVAARFDNYHLDFWTAFTVPAGKRSGYNNMIGNFVDLTDPHSNGEEFKPFNLNLPLPFFFSRDSGVALPTAALPYNEMRVQFSFRRWDELLIVDEKVNDSTEQVSRSPTIDEVGGSEPALTDVNVWANYAIVSNDERKRMACAPRDILIEQVQTAPRQTFTPGTDATPRYDIRFSHAIKVLFFGVRNRTFGSQWSNYTSASPIVDSVSNTIDYGTSLMTDPIRVTSLIYENTNRLSQMGSDYYSLVNPWYHAPVIPLDTGYHMYSYSLDFICLDPMGSTNYGKLTNVSIVPEASSDAVNASGGPAKLDIEKIPLVGSGVNVPQRYEFVATAVNNNIIRISGGALGFPVL